MSIYYREHDSRGHRRLKKFLRIVFWLILAIVLVGLALLARDIYNQSKVSDQDSKLSKPINSTVVSNTVTHTTPYFQIKTPTKWRAVTNETRDGHYVFRQFSGQLVEQEIIVKVNDQSQDVLPLVQVTRVLPVNVTDEGNFIVAEQVSDHCKKSVKPGTDHTPQIITVSRTTFACNPDSTSYMVVVGQIGKTNTMLLPRPNGQTAPYRITYLSSSALPTARDFINIVETFETR